MDFKKNLIVLAVLCGIWRIQDQENNVAKWPKSCFFAEMAASSLSRERLGYGSQSWLQREITWGLSSFVLFLASVSTTLNRSVTLAGSHPPAAVGLRKP